MSALMNECKHGADGSYSVSGDPPHDYACPYCKIEELLKRIEELEFGLEVAEAELWGE
jgi:hypothetical protein